MSATLRRVVRVEEAWLSGAHCSCDVSCEGVLRRPRATARAVATLSRHAACAFVSLHYANSGPGCVAADSVLAAAPTRTALPPDRCRAAVLFASLSFVTWLLTMCFYVLCCRMCACACCLVPPVTVKVEGRTVTVTGPRGTLTQSFDHIKIQLTKVGGRTIRLDMYYANRKQLACVKTVGSHIRNMCTGVTEGFKYLMRFAYSHFPINVTVSTDGKTLYVRNYLGERNAREIAVPEGVTAVRTPNNVQKDQLELTGNDINAVGRAASLVNQSCKAKNKDIRKFLDGIYVSAKGPTNHMKFI